jgi:hypothetical protein
MVTILLDLLAIGYYIDGALKLPKDFRVEKLFQVTRNSPHIELFQGLSRRFSPDLWSFAE